MTGRKPKPCQTHHCFPVRFEHVLTGGKLIDGQATMSPKLTPGGQGLPSSRGTEKCFTHINSLVVIQQANAPGHRMIRTESAWNSSVMGSLTKPHHENGDSPLSRYVPGEFLENASYLWLASLREFQGGCGCFHIEDRDFRASGQELRCTARVPYQQLRKIPKVGLYPSV